MIVLDASGVLAALDRNDQNHLMALATLKLWPRPYVIPAPILAEAASLVHLALGAAVLDAFLSDLESGAFLVDCGESDIPRIRELISRYADLPLTYPDAAAIACVQRRAGHLLTFDRRLSVARKMGVYSSLDFMS